MTTSFFFAGLRVRHQIPSTENMIEKAASSTITRKMPSTTERVVRVADAGGVALYLEALIAAHQRDHEGKDRRLDQAHQEGVDPDGLLQLAHEDREW